MKLVNVLQPVCLLGFLFAIGNTAMPMMMNMDDVKLPNFVCASEKTRIILSGYTQVGYEKLFESTFPVSNFDDIVQAVNSIKEIKDFTFSPELTSDVSLKLEEILCNLILYLRHKINENQAELLPEIKANCSGLSIEQKDILDIVCKKHSCIMCVLGTAACGFAAVAIAIALFISDNYPAKTCFE